MGITHSTARVIAPLSFVYDFVAQQFGIFGTPSMMDIHKRNLAAFSPRGEFIAGFFAPQQVFQLVWLYKLWNGRTSATSDELDQMVDFAPWYTLGNVCIGTWMFFWNSENLKTANIFVIINTLSQLTYIATRLKPMNTKSTNSVLTHVVAKTFAGIGVLDLLHNTSAAYFVGVPPSSTVKLLTGAGFAAAGAMSDWIFGGCLVYDLIALSVGQTGSWSQLLGGYAAMTAGIVGLKNWFMPPYVGGSASYERVGGV